MGNLYINVKIVEADGTFRDERKYRNPPKPAKEILEHLQAGGRVGELLDSEGCSLSGSDPLDDSQQ